MSVDPDAAHTRTAQLRSQCTAIEVAAEQASSLLSAHLILEYAARTLAELPALGAEIDTSGDDLGRALGWMQVLRKLAAEDIDPKSVLTDGFDAGVVVHQKIDVVTLGEARGALRDIAIQAAMGVASTTGGRVAALQSTIIEQFESGALRSLTDAVIAAPGAEQTAVGRAKPGAALGILE